MSLWDDAEKVGGDIVGDVVDAGQQVIDDAAKAAQEAADALAAAAEAAKEAAEKAAEAAKEALDQAIRAIKDGGNDIERAAEEIGHAAEDIVSKGVEIIKYAVDKPEDALKDLEHTAAKTVSDVADFVDKNKDSIITAVEVVGMVALSASGVGAVGAAIIGAGMTTGGELAQGAKPEDAFLDGGAVAVDKFVPGGGDAAKAVVKGIENGDSPEDIAKNAGLLGMGSNGGAIVGFGATIVKDASDGADAGKWTADLANQYAASATEGQPLAQFGVDATNDIARGKGIDSLGYDALKVYLHGAAGGDASPTAQATDTFFGDLSDGKSLNEALKDTYDQAMASIDRVNKAVPGGVDKAIDESGVPGAVYGKTLLDDLVAGKNPDDIAKDLGRRALGDAVDASGVGDDLKDHGIDTKELDPLKKYGDTALDGIQDGKSPDDIVKDLVKVGVKDAAERLGSAADDALHDAGVDPSKLEDAKDYRDLLVSDVEGGKNPGEILKDLGDKAVGDAADATGIGDKLKDYGLDADQQATIGERVSKLAEAASGDGSDGDSDPFKHWPPLDAAHVLAPVGPHQDGAGLLGTEGTSAPEGLRDVDAAASSLLPEASLADHAGLGGLFEQAGALQSPASRGSASMVQGEFPEAVAASVAGSSPILLDVAPEGTMGHDLPPVFTVPDHMPQLAVHEDPIPVESHLPVGSLPIPHFEHLHA